MAYFKWFLFLLIGVPFELSAKLLSPVLAWHEGNPEIGDKSGVSGLCRWFMERDGKLICWQVYYVKHYRIFGHWKCVRFGAGWKIWGDSQAEIEADPYCPHWLYFHPMKGSGLEEDK